MLVLNYKRQVFKLSLSICPSLTSNVKKNWISLYNECD